jgi:peptidoglycan L-alanyl-D-glutamate endopeptidase CwlK
MGFALTERDREILRGVHPDLSRVVERAAELAPFRFQVVEGLRTVARQRQLKAQGLSKTLNSRHLTGHAVDIVPYVDLNADGKIKGDEMWHHSQLLKLAPSIKRAFRECRVPYDWGGDWRNAWDKPHWQLPWANYPVQTASLFSDPELEAAWAEVQEDGRMETPVVTPAAARLGVDSAALMGGAGIVGDAVSELQKADAHLSAGTTLGLVIGGVILTLAAMSLYDRWDAAGRPLPKFLRRVFG